jgi:Poly(3-hydroxyalkanoate) synthetase
MPISSLEWTEGSRLMRLARRPLNKAWLLVLLVCLLSGCGLGRGEEAWTNLANRGAGYEFKPADFRVSPFNLSGLLKGSPGASTELVVYLEGDGRGVIKGRVTQDPTPSRAMGFELARSDPAPAVLYLARIGQFQSAQTGQKYQAYWSNKRLAEEAVQAAGQAIDEAKARLGARRIHLIGYSGGGGLAILLAERRSDVASLSTVAGLLDTYWWVREQNYQPLTGSLNPADQAARLTSLPQVHFYGRDDSIIPPDMSAHFQTLAPFTNFQRVGLDTNHWKAWPELWPGLLKKYLLPVRSKAHQG